tara:strand:+ start:10660 stop:12246 length:1587 start_codon:yes stop_codon:yes gene_type:complete
MSTYTGAGIAKGAADVATYAREKPERDLRLQEAQSRQKLSSLKLDEYQANSPMRDSAKDVEIQGLKNELYKGQASGLQAKTFDAFDRYQGDRNVRHLNNFFAEAKQNPIGAKMYQQIARVDSINTPEGLKLLEQAGIDPAGAENLNYVLATKADGTQEIRDMNQVYAMTGYTKRMDDQALDRLSKEALNAQRLRSGMKSGRITDTQRLAEIIMGENKDMSKQEAWEEATGILKPGSTSRGSELERMTDEIMLENPELSKVEAYAEAVALKKAGGTYKERLANNREKGTSSSEDESLYTESIRSVNQVKIDEVNTAKDSLDEMFEGSFTDSNMTVPANRTKASRLMSRVEKEFPMNVADRKVAKEIRQLAALGDVAGSEITDQQAGPIDSLIRGVKKYISNDVEGVAGTAAYESFRNVLRHSLYGATVSKGETQTFTSAMGSLGEQKGPVLVKLKSQLGDLKEQLSSVYDMNDPYVAKYRLNMDQDQLADVISALDERIDMMDGMLKKDAPGVITPKLSIKERYDARNN